ncbi:hypothetical protein LBMAG42_40850 [Deltaproteobacteria bacterium]|nr:hypothetical protein LBMAG42_40850 [Deltaproteobacteria bacterium]
MASNVRALPLLIAFASLPGCEEAADTGAATPSSGDVVAIPSHLDFGEVAQGVSHTLSASVQNVGDAAAEVVSVTSDSGQLTTDLSRGTTLSPNGFVAFSVDWLPEPGATLDDAVTVTVSRRGGELDTISLPITGYATGPILALTTDTLDVGAVGVGCSASAWVTAENLGSDVLRIEDIELTADREFQLSDIAGEALTLPWALAPGATQSARLTYTPTTEAAQSAHLVITTNDVYTPIADLDVAGTGTMEWITQDEEVEEQAIAAIVVANEVLLSMYADEFEAALPYFFEALLARKVPFRIAFTMDAAGKIWGDTAYIDDSYAPLDAASGAVAMLGETVGNDNDALLRSFLDALAGNQLWLIDESAQWAASQLNFVGINNDQEQSGLSARAFVENAADFKAGEAGMITVHAVAGDEPGGCGGADPAGELYEATVYTGGTFASICNTDWPETLVALAEGMPGASAYLFVLDETPVDGSLTVSVDGVLAESGWGYSQARNTVIFDEGSRPESGAVVTLRYAKVCEGE